MSRRKFAIAALASVIGLSIACNHQAPAECKELCALTEEQQHQRFKNYPPEKQFDLYAYCENEKTCMRDSESPHDYYGEWIAQDDKAVPFLVEKLKTEKDERVQWDILYVLRAMAASGHLRGRHDVAEVATHTADNMKGSFINRLFGEKWAIEQSKEWAKEIELNTHD